VSTVKANNVQVGQSGTATNNFTLYQPSTPDGTVRLAVGNSGATTGDVLSVSNTGLSVTGTLSATGNVTLSGGTANGVLYLNASKVATSGSALTFDGTNLGIGTSSPARKLQVNSGGAVAARFTRSGGTVANNSLEWFDGTNAWYAGVSGSNFWGVGYNTSGAIDNAAIRLDTSGNLGLGVTPSAWGSNFKAIQVGDYAAFSHYLTAAAAIVSSNARNSNNTDWVYLWTGVAATRYETGLGAHRWYTAPSGTAGATTSITSGQVYTVTTLGSTTLGQWQAYFSGLSSIPSIGQSITATATGTLAGGATVTQTITFTQAMTLDASGNLGVGATSPAARLDLGTPGNVRFINAENGVDANFRATFSSNTVTFANTGGSGVLAFQTGGSERARITSGGYFKASNTGTYQDSAASYHELRSSTNDTEILYASHTSASVPIGITLKYTAASPNGAASAFLYCSDSTAVRAYIRSDGGLANYQANDANLSDERLKIDITPVASYWDKIKSLEIVSFKYKDQTDDIANIGVIAQQVEAVAPEFVSNDGFGEAPEGEAPYKTIYTTDMYHAAIKALQEAMTRIEILEAKVAQLEGNQP